MYYTVYKITNLINNKIYIGAHKTLDVDDGYMGSGVYLKRAQNKYGIENFEKTLLAIFQNSDDMYCMESMLVNENFIATTYTYNLVVGGYGGDRSKFIDYDKRGENKDWQAATKNNAKKAHGKMSWLAQNDQIWSAQYSDTRKNIANAFYKKGGTNGFSGKKHSKEFKEKMLGHKRQSGNKNSQYGTMWITDGEKNKKINKVDIIPDGWYRGRKCKK